MPGAMRHEDMGTPLTKTIQSVSAKSPAHAKGGTGHFESIYPKELISRPLLHKWNNCLQTYFDPRPGDVYFFEEEELISLHSEKTSFRARIVLRRKDASFPDLVMEWSCKMVLQKPAREDAVRRAMIQFKESKRVSFDGKENKRSKG